MATRRALTTTLLASALWPASASALPPTTDRDQAFGAVGANVVVPAPRGDGEGVPLAQRAVVRTLAGDASVAAGAQSDGQGRLDGYVVGLDRSGDAAFPWKTFDGWGGTGPIGLGVSPDGSAFAVVGVGDRGTVHVEVFDAGGVRLRGGSAAIGGGAARAVGDVLLDDDLDVTAVLTGDRPTFGDTPDPGTPWRVVRLRPEGPGSMEADPSWDGDGALDGPGAATAQSLVARAGGGVVVGGRVTGQFGSAARIWWRNADGSPWLGIGNVSLSDPGAVNYSGYDDVVDLSARGTTMAVLVNQPFFGRRSWRTVIEAGGQADTTTTSSLGSASSIALGPDDRRYIATTIFDNIAVFEGSTFQYSADSGRTTEIQDLAHDGSGRLLFAGAQGGLLAVGRAVPRTFTDFSPTLDERTEAVGPGASSVPLARAAVPPPSVAPWDDPLTDQGSSIAAAPLRSSPLRSSPLRSSPLRSSPLRSSPLRSSPLRSSPLRSSPLRSSSLVALPLRSSPLRSSPLRSSGASSWEAVLAESSLAGRPWQTLTLEDVLDAIDGDDPRDDILRDLALSDLDLEASALRGLSIGALFLLYRPVTALGPWCERLEDRCVAGKTLADLQLTGADLADLWDEPLPLTEEVLGIGSGADAPLAEVDLNDVDLRRTAFSGVLVREVPALCREACAGDDRTMAEAQADDPSFFDNTLGAAIGTLRSGGTLLTLQQVLPGLLADEELPVERFGITDLLARRTPGAGAAVTVTGSTPIDCRGWRSRYADVRLHAFGGGGAVLEPGAVVRFGSDPEIPVSRPAGDGVGVWAVPSAALQAACEDRVEDTLSFRFSYEPSSVLGTDSVSAYLSTGSESTTESRTFVTVADTDDPTPTAPATAQSDTLYAGWVAEPGDADTFSYDLGTLPAGSVVSVSLTNPGGRDVGGGGEGCEFECEGEPRTVFSDFDLFVQGPPVAIPLPPVTGATARHASSQTVPVADSSRSGTGDETEEVPEGPASTGPIPASLPTSDGDWGLGSRPLRGQSTRRGGANESASVLVRDGDRGKRLRITVAGHDGASDVRPYGLRVTVSPPATTPPCIEARTPDTAAPGTADAVTTATQTLVLWNRQRTAGTYGAAAASTLETKLRSLPGAAVVAVDATAAVRSRYAAWDADRCSSAKANDVVAAIAGIVADAASTSPALRHVVLAGGDDLLPQARVPDQTGIGNEVEEADGLTTNGNDTPISRALRDGLVLSDDPFADLDPYAWLDGTLAVPDLALGRLVETPGEMVAQIDRFTQSGGVLAPESSRVMGYEFLSDGAAAVRDALAPLGLPTQERIDDGWSGALATQFLTSAAPAIASVNAHYDHYQGLPADRQGLFTAAQASPAPGSLLFTMGCHGGLNAVDVYVRAPSAAGDKPDDLRDWPQEMTGRGALYTGNTGFGYGDVNTVAFSERLMALYAGQLAGRKATAGQALMYAKAAYMAGLLAPSVYDAKSLQQATFYGLPMYRVTPAGTVGASAVPPDQSGTPGTVERTFEVRPQHAEQNTARGRWWKADDRDPIAVPLRPLQPRTDLDVTSPDGIPVHGALITALESTTRAVADPAFVTPTVDQGSNEPELGVADAAFPSVLQRVDGQATAEGRRELLTLAAGQFLAPQTQVLYTRIAGRVLRSRSTDYDPPRITAIEAEIDGGTSQLTIDVTSPDEDATGGVALYQDDGGTWRSASFAPRGDGQFRAAGSVEADEVPRIYVQLRDGAGNVGADTNKGTGYSATGIAVDAPPEPVTSRDPDLVRGGVRWFDGPVTVSLASGSGDVSVDGGPRGPYTGPVTFDTDGPHSFRAFFDDGGGEQVRELTLAVDASPPDVTGGLPGLAGFREGWYRTDVDVTWSCADGPLGVGIDPDGCPAPSTITGEGAARSVTGVARDRLGNERSQTVTAKIDRTPPEVAVTTPAQSTSATSVTVSGTASDALSGIAGVVVGTGPADGTTSWSRSGVPLPVCGPNPIQVTVADKAGNEAQATVTITRTCDGGTPTTRSRLLSVRSDVAALSTSQAVAAKDRDRYAKALASLDGALAAELWPTPGTLDPKKGHKLFDELKQAVVQLRLVAAPPQALVDRLVAVARAAAETAVAGIGPGANAAQAKKAREALASGPTRTDPVKAIDDYRSAWDSATKA
jgi:hypothetical protein